VGPAQYQLFGILHGKTCELPKMLLNDTPNKRDIFIYLLKRKLGRLEIRHEIF